MDKIAFDKRYAATTLLISSWSKCVKLKVGSVLVSPENRIISTGYNGQISGQDNVCEDCEGKTKITCFHAEENLLLECLRRGISTKNHTIYTSHFPCPSCSKLIAGAGIKRVVYVNEYRDMNGLEMFRLFNIDVEQYKLEDVLTELKKAEEYYIS